MKERPILFSGPMVRAILDGRKTQFRRPVKWPVLSQCDGSKRRVYTERDIAEMNERLKSRQRHPSHQFCPYGQPGDRLWVRETWRQFDAGIECACYDECFCRRYHGKPIYRADSDSEDKWRPSIHMPRWASRITLEITRVWVEMVQDITEEDAKNEGVKIGEDRSHSFAEHGLTYRPHKDAFGDTWQSIYGTWDANPWVWAVEFRRVEP